MEERGQQELELMIMTVSVLHRYLVLGESACYTERTVSTNPLLIVGYIIYSSNLFFITAMIIGFIRREQTVSETLRSGVEQYDILVKIKSMLASEIDYELGVRVLGPTQQTSSDQAIVEDFDEAPVFRRDATFGSREIRDDPRSNLIVERKLNRHETDVASLTITIISDFLVEETECFDLSIYPINNEFMTEYFVGNDTASFFEKHTICILDDDGKFIEVLL